MDRPVPLGRNAAPLEPGLRGVRPGNLLFLLLPPGAAAKAWILLRLLTGIAGFSLFARRLGLLGMARSRRGARIRTLRRFRLAPSVSRSLDGLVAPPVARRRGPRHPPAGRELAGRTARPRDGASRRRGGPGVPRLRRRRHPRAGRRGAGGTAGGAGGPGSAPSRPARLRRDPRSRARGSGGPVGPRDGRWRVPAGPGGASRGRRLRSGPCRRRGSRNSSRTASWRTGRAGRPRRRCRTTTPTCRRSRPGWSACCSPASGSSSAERAAPPGGARPPRHPPRPRAGDACLGRRGDRRSAPRIRPLPRETRRPCRLRPRLARRPRAEGGVGAPRRRADGAGCAVSLRRAPSRPGRDRPAPLLHRGARDSLGGPSRPRAVRRRPPHAGPLLSPRQLRAGREVPPVGCRPLEPDRGAVS